MKLNSAQKKMLRAQQLASYEVADNAGTIDSFTIVDANGFIHEMKDGCLVPKSHTIFEDIKRKNLHKKDADTLLDAFAAFTLPPQEDK